METHRRIAFDLPVNFKFNTELDVKTFITKRSPKFQNIKINVAKLPKEHREAILNWFAKHIYEFNKYISRPVRPPRTISLINTDSIARNFLLQNKFVTLTRNLINEPPI